jgi:16S rRNA (adenine1518-N6/adenine1519-N6)-dimethyltransferase
MENFRNKKSLGQNFLVNRGILDIIIKASRILPEDTVVEIGPGKGVLTRKLLEARAKVIAIEKDDRLIPTLFADFKEEIETGKLRIIHSDILDLSVDNVVEKGKPYKVVANIPYYITGVLLRKFLESTHQPQEMLLMVQKEVAERIVARDGKESLLSLSVKAYGVPKIIKRVSRGSFSPAPNVDAAILSITKISKNFFKGTSEEQFFKLAKIAFAGKRKTLGRTLTKVFGPQTKTVLEKTHIDPKSRPENLLPEDWRKLSKFQEEMATQGN